MRRTLFAAGLSVLLASSAAAQPTDFAAGLAAYDAGRYEEAAVIWSRLAENGDPAAMVSLAGLYEAGFGVGRDPGRALALYRRAAALGDPQARRILALRGEGRGPTE